MGDLFGGKSAARAARLQAEQLARDAAAQGQVALANAAAAEAAAKLDVRMKRIADSARDALAPSADLVQIDLSGQSAESLAERRKQWGIGVIE